MAQYCVNNRAQTNGDHEVHRQGCQYMPGDYTRLGEHVTCYTAVAVARQIYPQSNGCYFCSRDCNTG